MLMSTWLLDWMLVWKAQGVNLAIILKSQNEGLWVIVIVQLQVGKTILWFDTCFCPEPHKEVVAELCRAWATTFPHYKKLNPSTFMPKR